MLNTMLPAVLFSWGLTFLLFRWFQKTESASLRIFLRVGMFIMAFILGLVGSFAVFFLSLWAMSGMSLSEFLNAPIGAGQQIMSWVRFGLSGAFLGSIIGQFRKWRRS